MNLHSINTEQGLYVMNEGGGFSCYGFEVLDRKAKAIRSWRGLDPSAIDTHAKGTREHFEACDAEFAAGSEHAGKTGQKCPAELTPALLGLEGRRVEVTLPDGERERFIVGRSGGWMPCHLAIARRTSTGGPAVYMPAGSTVRTV